jgi:hypothetical protein
VNLDFLARVHGAKTGDGMGGVGYAKLAAENTRGLARLKVGNVQRFSVPDLWVGDSAQQVADEAVELGIGDEMCGLLMAQRPAQNAREAEQGRIATGEAKGPAIGADQFALDAKRGGLKRNEIYVFERGAVNSLAKHCLRSFSNPAGK